MGLSYFIDKENWSNITREERFFCSYLYHTLISNRPCLEKFLNLLGKAGEGTWEVGYEVCFYRDILFSRGVKIKEYNKSNPHKKLPQKRTFDLCLFSENEIIIIEAKCNENFNKRQYDALLDDTKHIKEIVNDKIKLNYALIIRSEYEEIIKKNLQHLLINSTRITWKQIADNFTIYSEIFNRADNLRAI